MMEPHATIAAWDGDKLWLADLSQRSPDLRINLGYIMFRQVREPRRDPDVPLTVSREVST
jgi:hypothetical protein